MKLRAFKNWKNFNIIHLNKDFFRKNSPLGLKYIFLDFFALSYKQFVGFVIYHYSLLIDLIDLIDLIALKKTP